MTTVVAVREGRRICFAADTQATVDSMLYTHHKIYQVGPYWFGSSGSLADTQATIRSLVVSYAAGEHEDPYPEKFIEHLPENNDSYYLLAVNHQLYYIPPDGAILEVPDKTPTAIGSGSDLALGAVAAGASLHEAVEIAIRYDVNSGGAVTEMTV